MTVSNKTRGRGGEKERGWVGRSGDGARRWGNGVGRDGGGAGAGAGWKAGSRGELSPFVWRITLPLMLMQVQITNIC